MADKLYPYIDEIIASGIPFTVIAAGTQLPVDKKTMPFPTNWPERDRVLLKELNEKSTGFSTRGSVTQEFCSELGLTTANNGDIAFFDPRFDDRAFVPNREIKKIAISDPHYWRSFLPEFRDLRDGLQKRFPEAEIVVAFHGKSKFEDFLNQENIKILRLYDDLEKGLDFYDTVDLHVGFRVHAHVSALARRKYSYLIEQDGRGCDYGRYMNANISMPCHINKTNLLLSKIFRAKTLSRLSKRGRSSAITQLLGVIGKDQRTGFSTFSGLENQITQINADNIAFLKRHLPL